MIKLRPLKYVVQAFFVADDGETVTEASTPQIKFAPKDWPQVVASLEALRIREEAKLNEGVEP